MKIIYSLFAIFLLTSCEAFLTYKDNDKIVPTTLENFSEMAYTELMANTNAAESDYLNVMTDDLESFVIARIPDGSDVDNREIYSNHYKWAVETQYTIYDKEREDMTWNSLYRRIFIANVIEDNMNNFEDDVTGVRERLLGEVKFIRAISYFNLINIYAAPYISASEATTQLAVPINSSASIDTKIYKRDIMSDVCNLIERNLLESIVHFQKGQKKDTRFRPNVDAARLYLTRYYLYTKQWEKVVEISNQFFSETNRSITTKLDMIKYAGDKGILTKANSSVIFSWGETKALDFATSGDNKTANRGRFITSADLLSKFDLNDKRKTSFFKNIYSLDFMPFKYDPFANNSKAIYTNTIRYEEVMLNRAEANIELGQINNALNDINTLRRERIDGAADLIATDMNSARSLLRDEKRREFCFEGLRWFDIRRWNLSITHIYHDFADASNISTYVLPAGSPNYVMPLPLNLVRKNSEIEQFTRNNCQVK